MKVQKDSSQRARILAAFNNQDGDDEITIDDIRAALQEEGITDLETLATRLHERIRKLDDSKPQPIGTSGWPALLKPATRPEGLEIVHQEPAMPLLVDGVQYKPKEIHRFDGKPLFFVLTPINASEKMLVAYTDFGPIMTYLQTRWVESQINPLNYPSNCQPRYCYGAKTDASGFTYIYQYICGMDCPPPPPPPQPLPPPPPPPPPSLEAIFWQDESGAGNSISLTPNYYHSDLTKVYMDGMWPFNTNWNDRISAVCLNWATVLCAEHTNFEGSRILLKGSDWMDLKFDLSGLGWNDRISSMWNFGALF